MTNPPYILEHLNEMCKILNHRRVYSFLHVPVQAGSTKVLADMKRQYTIEDFEHVCDTLLKNVPTFKHGYYRFEVGSAQPVEIRKFVELAKEICHNNKTHLDFGAIPYRKNEMMSSEVNISELSALGWSPEVPLLDGLKNTIEIEKKGKKYLCVT
jgi:nucleoside-diphosphate-sugar epimerase